MTKTPLRRVSVNIMRREWSTVCARGSQDDALASKSLSTAIARSCFTARLLSLNKRTVAAMAREKRRGRPPRKVRQNSDFSPHG
jgi:hypothetical protein